MPTNEYKYADGQGLSALSKGIFQYQKLSKFYNEISLAAANGNKSKYQVGTTFSGPWKDTQSGISYDNPWRVNHYEDCEIEGGDVIPGMWLQNVYASPFGVQFSHQRAFLRCPNGLAAGTYYFTFESTWGSNVAAGDIVCFTLTNAVPEGGRIAGCYGAPDQAKSNWRIYVYDSTGKTILETITPTFTASGTSLGTMKASARNEDLNSAQEMAYGWNRWKTSAIRQFLNSDQPKNLWWTAQDEWDIAPDQLTTKDGFLCGLSEELKSIIQPVKYTTYTNTVNDGGEADITYDRVGLISLEQMYVSPQIAGEGTVHDYWKNLNGTSTPWARSTAYDILKQYAVESHSSAQYVRLRSAYRGGAFGPWHVYTSGSVYYGNASIALRFEPLVFISNPIIGSRSRATAEAVDNLAGNFAGIEGPKASKNYSSGEYLTNENKFYKASTAIASGETITPGTNITKTDVATELNALKTALTAAESSITILTRKNTWADRVIAARSQQKSKYPVGTTFSSPWRDTQTNTSYDNPWRVNHYEACELESGITIPGMWIQNQYASPFGVQFSHPRAFLKCPNGLAAGSYYFTFDENWGSGDKAVAQGDIVCFTLATAVPEGGRIAGLYGGVDNAHSSWRVYVYDADGKTILETVTPVFVAVDGATNLGAMKLNQRSGDLNSAREMAYGWNRWKYSAIRQYLNSDAVKGAWWTPTDEWDIAPDQLATKDGYLRGLEEELLEILQPVKTITYMNTVNDGGADDYDVTYDKIIIPSLEQMYIDPQHSGEGSSHEYWKNLNGTSTKWAQGGTYDALKQYGVEAKTTAQYVRLRSADRGSAFVTWYVGTSGSVYSYSASYANRFEPLGFI